MSELMNTYEPTLTGKIEEPLTAEQTEGLKQKITALLRSTKREGIDDLISGFETGGFFGSPASTQYHGNWPGGLAAHSYAVYETYCRKVAE